MVRNTSKKPVLSLEECTHPFRVVFLKSNSPRGVFIGINDTAFYHPVGEEVELTEPEYQNIKSINGERGFYDRSKHDFDPFI